MKRILTLFVAVITALTPVLAVAQVSPGSGLSKVAGITVSGNYAKWKTRALPQARLQIVAQCITLYAA